MALCCACFAGNFPLLWEARMKTGSAGHIHHAFQTFQYDVRMLNSERRIARFRLKIIPAILCVPVMQKEVRLDKSPLIGKNAIRAEHLQVRGGQHALSYAKVQ